MRYLFVSILFCLCLLYFKVRAQHVPHLIRKQIDLNGVWTMALDPRNVGLERNWQDSILKDEIKLPGTLEEQDKGNKVTHISTKYLNQSWQYVGAAWYQKKVEIPISWSNKLVQLFLGRTKVTQVWIDGKLIGRKTLLSATQIYELKEMLPGKHTITILVDNSPKLVAVGGSHALSEHTQTNWNGVIGKMYIEATEKLKIDWLKVAPDVKNKMVNIWLKVVNLEEKKQDVSFEIKASALHDGKKQAIDPIVFKAKLESTDSVFHFSYALGADAVLWNEYHPFLYKLIVSLSDRKGLKDQFSTNFGLREFKATSTQFTINDVVTFLRGKNDACIFPLTGYPPMETAMWQKVFRIAKTYGINHYRFHSYTPPEAAFEAADLEGIYIQSELPNWANFNVKDTVQFNFQLGEGKAIIDALGNHPSFVMLSLGNELGGDKVVNQKLIAYLKEYDGQRRLYAYGTNAFYEDSKSGEKDDFWVTMRTGNESPQHEFDVRGSFATTEDASNGIINSKIPSTLYNFSSAIKNVKLPVIGHETGQFQIYPDYTEIVKYTGKLRPLNFEIFKKRLQDAGMGNQAVDFFKASGQLTALLYREEIEMALRTPGFAGFQLLDLQDFPGQGTALVGLLNAFMDNKGLISAEDFKKFNNDVVIQLLMNKYCWKTNETYQANIQLVNYSPKDINNKTLNWIVTTEDGGEIAKGNLTFSQAQKGGINAIGQLTFSLQKVSKASKLLIKLQLKRTPYEITYPLWVYPENVDITSSAITLATKLDVQTLKVLDNGGSVLLFPDHAEVKDKSVGPQFIAEFWNWLVFKGAAKNMNRPESAGTLGILTNPTHPIFNDFPTDFHTNWQWWSIVKNSRPLILDQTDLSYRPIVQVIDNIDRNHKLGLIFEFEAGKGKLLISMVNLPAIIDQPEARQLYHSILNYMNSTNFSPKDQISVTQLKELLNLKTL